MKLPLVARLGVSRTPIRLALDRLSHEGLPEISPSGGFVRYASSPLTTFGTPLKCGAPLEGTAARLAAERHCDASELVDLNHYRQEMEKYSGPVSNIDSHARYLDLNESFHAEVVRLAKSPMLRRTLDHVMTLPFAQPSAVIFAHAKLPKIESTFSIGQEQHQVIRRSDRTPSGGAGRGGGAGTYHRDAASARNRAGGPRDVQLRTRSVAGSDAQRQV